MIAQDPGLPAPERNRIDALFAHFNNDTPGAAVAVAREGVVLYAQGYGTANLEYGIPITQSSIFHVASISKEFTAMCIVLLAQHPDQKKLLADDPARTPRGLRGRGRARSGVSGCRSARWSRPPSPDPAPMRPHTRVAPR